MATSTTEPIMIEPAHVYDEGSEGAPVWLARNGTDITVDDTARRWLDAVRFTPGARKQVLIPGAGGSIAGVALGMGDGTAGEPSVFRT